MRPVHIDLFRVLANIDTKGLWSVIISILGRTKIY